MAQAPFARRILAMLTPAFFGEITLSVKAGKIVNVKVIRSEQPDGELEVLELFRALTAEGVRQ
jgi:hypothetical protein